MPSERFYKLDPQKQERILDAAAEEFTREGYQAASINQIIKDADISRGSFYTYFLDKHDLFDFIFEQIKDNAVARIVQSLQAHDGRMFETCRELMEEGFALPQQCTHRFPKLICKLFTDYSIMEHLTESRAGDCEGQARELQEGIDRLYPYLKQEGLSREDFYAVSDLLITISIKALIESFRCPERTERLKERLYREYDMIEAGIKEGEKR